MQLTWDLLAALDKDFGDSFYILDLDKLKQNYTDLTNSFRNVYPKSNIGYSYKTNYIPLICRFVDSQGGYAEVVSQMEYRLAETVGVKPVNIIFNGPYKRWPEMEEALVKGATVNLDSPYEAAIVRAIALKHPNNLLAVGFRCNFDIGQNYTSRFGFDVDDEQFIRVFQELKTFDNIRVRGIHCHFSTPQRTIESYQLRTKKMLEVCEICFDEACPEFIDIGGGYFSRMPPSLRRQFPFSVPTYEEYAEAIASQFRDKFPGNQGPELIIEPGAALVADTMKFAAKVVGVKQIRSTKFALVSGSIQNVKPTMNEKNLPVQVYSRENASPWDDTLEIVGYTCMEKDYLYNGYRGKLETGDYVVFDNVGAYTIVLKPPFIQTSPAILVFDKTKGKFELARRRETFSDLFNTYVF